MMMGKRLGKWAWALSADERLAAAGVDQARGGEIVLSAKLKRVHSAMLEKQKKLLARGLGAGSGRPSGRYFQTS
jgi:hypothetical protein